MARIERVLADLAVPSLLFSYRGITNRTYFPWHTRVRIAEKSRDISDFMRAISGGQVLMVGHSQGGTLAASWVCQHASDSELGRLAGVMFIAAPLVQPEAPEVWTDETRTRYVAYTDAMDGYRVDMPQLVRSLANKIVVVRAWHDPLAPQEMSSFLEQDRRLFPLAETVVDSSHRAIMDHWLTAATLSEWVSEQVEGPEGAGGLSSGASRA